MRIGNLQLLSFYITELKYQKDFTLKELVNDLTIINQSEGFDLYVNNTQLVEGQQFNIGGNYGEVNLENYTCRFVANGNPVVLQRAIVLLKQYKNIQQ
jgi:hypothetical protein